MKVAFASIEMKNQNNQNLREKYHMVAFYYEHKYKVSGMCHLE